MGMVRTEITLKNAVDVINAETGIVKEKEVRQMTVRALVDTGAWTLVINEDIREKLGLAVRKSAAGTLADGSKMFYNLAGPLEINWKERMANLDALILPNADEVLLGAIPLEAMDLMVDPRKEEVVGAHGDTELHSVK
jgi:clan AA aspartic protease